MKQVEIMVIGGGPAGLCAALSAASRGAKVLLVESNERLGGQLIKQTHKFFGSKKQYAGERGIHIAEKLLADVVAAKNIEAWKDCTAYGIYDDGVVTVEYKKTHAKVKPKRIIIATGASEKILAFPGNDLPGIYGAGAVQTLMNVEGIKPAERVLMVGAGNIGMIVAYQLKQAGVEVVAVIEGSPTIGGYLVHASKIQRAGIPVLTRHTIAEAHGNSQVEGAIIAEIDENWQILPGTEREAACDAICLAVGLSPLTELAWQAGCQMKYIKELSGHVPIVDENLETTRPGIYCAGDICAIEEASSAMVEGRLAGISAASALGYANGKAEILRLEAIAELNELRNGPTSADIRLGLEKLRKKSQDNCRKKVCKEIHTSLVNDGVPTTEDVLNITPSKERLKEGPVAIIECFEQIPCDPCVIACKRGAITLQGDMNGLPVLDSKLCDGCGICISHCPGLAVFVVDKSYSKTNSLIRLPYEYLPVPKAGDFVTGLDRAGQNLGAFEVIKILSGGSKNKTYTISLAVPHDLAMEVRNIAPCP